RTTSVQLPDLLSSISPFELRTNKHCRTVSRATERWLVERGLDVPGRADSDAEEGDDAWTWDKDVKLGLLAAACYPCADVTPLRFVADFLGVLFFDASRGVGEEGDVFALLSDRLSRIAYKNPSWYLRFLKSQRSYQDAKRRLYCNDTNNDKSTTDTTNPPLPIRPDLESYIELRREASGVRMAFDMIEYVEDLVLGEEVIANGLFRKVKDHACNVAVWSEDIVSCTRGISPNTPPNLVTTLMKERHLPLDGALVLAGTLVQQSVDAFLDSERALLAHVRQSQVQHQRERGGTWDVERYVRGLRNWVAGFVNWLYESRVYFGDKGMEVRTFGWVFVPVE
ncbi:isoprenoid synthase domain-containing protein, partial [Phlebopus sp. FC_14]